jgi:hypothetical protein
MSNPDEIPNEKIPGSPEKKNKIKIMKKNGTFVVNGQSLTVNDMNDSTITLRSADKIYTIRKKNNTYEIDGVTFQIKSSNIQTQPNGSIMVNVTLSPQHIPMQSVPSYEPGEPSVELANARFMNPHFANVKKPLKGGKKQTSRKRRPSKMSKRLKTRRVI